ncbi:MAG: ATP-binding cassette domain-containing protein [Levilactobacillus sp.]|jgi:lincosamide and streptogramin A transport system ATP-binding/permease protein|uniref:ribosomal protection-like ABC-F family protein n=1 Tax=Levilactobacillus sp. TaxID=2767919 RepID=UPI00258F6CE5|nr:ATP-binding cassette domain-containing protein [Levilactobacillus sp.]MCI1554295.1 ATP-binding cassette domain-containing protein [Levilactobacillus sp.]MCI1598596.1 ATP-binding cassette domain-containing protein [Levilactobacillus sp.]MCI1606251.1 ATP-binding cassette domain-containing protein [Levilactobacillus sp.]
MPKVSLHQLTFGFASNTDLLFDHVDLDLDTRWKLGLVGRNGRGKTTLFNLLQGHYPYQGHITSTTPYTYFPAPVPDPTLPAMTVLQATADVADWQVVRELRQLQLDPQRLEQPFAALSGGEQTKALLAILFADETALPLIDEPTNHLDLASRQQVADYLKRQRRGFIVVSHDRHFLNQVTDHTLAIERRQIRLYQGNFAVYEDQKQRQDAFEAQQDAKLKKEADRLKQVAVDRTNWAQVTESRKHGNPHQKNSGWQAAGASALPAKMMKRAKNLERRRDRELQATEGLRQNIEHVAALSLTPMTTHYQPLIHVADFALWYGDRQLFQPVSFDLNAGDRLALVGPNGCGKSSFIHYLQGTFTGQHTGSATIHQQLTLSVTRQLTAENGSLTAFAAAHHLNYRELLNTLKKLGLPRDVFATPIDQMSLGQQKKIELAQSLMTPANLFIWDEPLNYLDVFNQDQLATLLTQTQPTLLLVEHDQDFIAAVATKVVRLRP